MTETKSYETIAANVAAVRENMRQAALQAGRDPEELYRRECLLKGFQEDRCALYVWRTAVYYAEHPDPEPEKLKWWYWKDRPYPPAEEGEEP